MVTLVWNTTVSSFGCFEDFQEAEPKQSGGKPLAQAEQSESTPMPTGKSSHAKL